MRPTFRLGTTSFIYRADWLTNVERLAGRVDDVEILLFDADPAMLPRPEEIAALCGQKDRSGLTYTVHGPLGGVLASVNEALRRTSVEAVCRSIEVARPLAPEAWILHMPLSEREGRTPLADLTTWRRCAQRSLEEILETGVDPATVCLEVLDYDFDRLTPVLEELDLGAALDLGHARRDGRSWMELVRHHLHRSRVIHWHGTDESGRDHQSLRHWPRSEGLELLRALIMAGYNGVLTLEVFGERELDESLAVLAELREELSSQWIDDR